MKKSKKIIILLLVISVVLSVFFTLFKSQSSPPCINADEAAFGYNAYSILNTGADEYGTTFPLRLKSFGDYKMPLYSYLTVPFVGIMGLNDYSIRALNVALAIFFPILMFFLAKTIFESEYPAAISSLLVSV
jgi:4-amino-4-deoxy-L-arabinose transferase-like glycosyltransferase